MTSKVSPVSQRSFSVRCARHVVQQVCLIPWFNDDQFVNQITYGAQRCEEYRRNNRPTHIVHLQLRRTDFGGILADDLVDWRKIASTRIQV